MNLLPSIAPADYGAEITETVAPSISWDLYLEDCGQRFDELPAMAQVVYAILRTKRYRYPIYTGNYGIYIDDLIGLPKRYLVAVLKARITEALLQDDRVVAVDHFMADPYLSKGHTLVLHFTVHTVFGPMKAKGGFDV